MFPPLSVPICILPVTISEKQVNLLVLLLNLKKILEQEALRFFLNDHDAFALPFVLS